ncbi:MAG: DUF192 domain-containing protein [Candidatus Azambacteria bacterium]|nr:DUF192 domain-containing protein [Candidatus Azambacteria bacterium]
MLIDSKRPFLLISAFLALSLSGIIIYQQYLKFVEKNTLTIYTGAGTVKIRVKYAITPEEQQEGLMNQSSLNKKSGMIFVFPEERNRGFWMKNVLIPLDVVFISSNGKINEITTLNLCSEEPCTVYNSKNPSKYVIEVNAGSIAKWKILEGDILEIKGF